MSYLRYISIIILLLIFSLSEASNAVVLYNSIEPANVQCPRTDCETPSDSSMSNDALQQDSVGDGDIPNATWPDPTGGLMIGFSLQNFCKRFSTFLSTQVIGDPSLDFNDICMEIIDCLGVGAGNTSGACTTMDCLRNFGEELGDASTEGEKFEITKAMKQCEFLCTLDPTNNACGWQTCIADIVNTYQDWKPPSKVCCRQLTMVSDKDIGENSAAIREKCNEAIAGWECVDSLIQYGTGFSDAVSNKTALPTPIFNNCCTGDVYNLVAWIIDGSPDASTAAANAQLNDGKAVSETLKTMCYYAKIAECAIAIANKEDGFHIENFLTKKGILPPKIYEPCCSDDTLGKIGEFADLVAGQVNDDANNPNQDPNKKTTGDLVYTVLDTGCGLTKSFSCLGHLFIAGVNTVNDVGAIFKNNSKEKEGYATDVENLDGADINKLEAIANQELGTSGQQCNGPDLGSGSGASKVVEFCCPHNNPSLAKVLGNLIPDTPLVQVDVNGSMVPMKKDEAFIHKMEKTCASLKVIDCAKSLTKDIGSVVSCSAGAINGTVELKDKIRASLPLNINSKKDCCPAKVGDPNHRYPPGLQDVLEPACAVMQMLECSSEIVNIVLEQLGEDVEIKTPDPQVEGSTVDASENEAAKESALDALKSGTIAGAVAPVNVPLPPLGPNGTLTNVCTSGSRNFSSYFRIPPSVQKNCCPQAFVDSQGNALTSFYDGLPPGFGEVFQEVCTWGKVLECVSAVAESFGIAPAIDGRPSFGTPVVWDRIAPDTAGITTSGITVQTDWDTQLKDALECALPLPQTVRESCCPGGTKTGGLDITTLLPTSWTDGQGENIGTAIGQACNFSAAAECVLEIVNGVGGAVQDSYVNIVSLSDDHKTSIMEWISGFTSDIFGEVLSPEVFNKCCPSQGRAPFRLPAGWTHTTNDGNILTANQVLDNACKAARKKRCGIELADNFATSWSVTNQSLIASNMINTIALHDTDGGPQPKTHCCAGKHNCFYNEAGAEECFTEEDLVPDFLVGPVKAACAIGDIRQCITKIYEVVVGTEKLFTPADPTAGISVPLLHEGVAKTCCTDLANGHIDIVGLFNDQYPNDTMNGNEDPDGLCSNFASTSECMARSCEAAVDVTYCLAAVIGELSNSDSRSCRSSCASKAQNETDCRTELQQRMNDLDVYYKVGGGSQLDNDANNPKTQTFKDFYKRCVKYKNSCGLRCLGEWKPPTACCNMAKSLAAFPDDDKFNIDVSFLDGIKDVIDPGVIRDGKIPLKNVAGAICSGIPDSLLKNLQCIEFAKKEPYNGVQTEDPSGLPIVLNNECCQMLSKYAGPAVEWGVVCETEGGTSCPGPCFKSWSGICVPVGWKIDSSTVGPIVLQRYPESLQTTGARSCADSISPEEEEGVVSGVSAECLQCYVSLGGGNYRLKNSYSGCTTEGICIPKECYHNAINLATGEEEPVAGCPAGKACEHSVAASLKFATNPSDGDNIKINDVTFTFVTGVPAPPTLTQVEIQIAGTLAGTLTGLESAVDIAAAKNAAEIKNGDTLLYKAVFVSFDFSLAGNGSLDEGVMATNGSLGASDEFEDIPPRCVSN